MVKYLEPELDLTFAALADPTRRRLLAALSLQPGRVTDLAEPYAMSLPAVSKHLRVLEKAGLLKRKRMGREHYLQFEAAPMKRAAGWIEHYRKFWESSLDNLASYLETEMKADKKSKQQPSRGRKGRKS